MAEATPEQSILLTIKKLLGLVDGYDVYDTDIIVHINSALSTLSQLGIGPENGYEINGPTDKWTDLLGEGEKPYLNQVKTYLYLRVRLIFDPPTTSFAIEAFQKQVDELTWRLSLYAPKTVYPPTVPEGQT
jgi:hypothetical protein